jgi:hypothetical protein
MGILTLNTLGNVHFKYPYLNIIMFLFRFENKRLIPFFLFFPPGIEGLFETIIRIG